MSKTISFIFKKGNQEDAKFANALLESERGKSGYTDITERLRDDEMYADACDEAAQLIEQQRAELARLKSEKNFLSGVIDGMKNTDNETITSLKAQIEALKNAIGKARHQLNSTQQNWVEECLFKCNDILKDALVVKS